MQASNWHKGGSLPLRDTHFSISAALPVSDNIRERAAETR